MISASNLDPRMDRARQSDSGRGAGIYVAFVPWALFATVTQHDSLRAAAVVALATGVAITVPSFLRGAPKVLEVAAVLTFAALTAVAFLADAATGELVAQYARAIAATGLAVTAFASLLFVPFTEQYARESVPRRFWDSAEFKQVNRRLTTMWGWVFVAMVPSHLIAASIGTPRANTVFNWVVPVVLIVWAAKRTEAVSESEHE